MKITDSENIKNGEMELIDALTGDLDWGAVEKILREKHKLGLHDEVEYNSGDMVVYNNDIAYKLNFDVKVKLSVLFNRKGECITLSTSADLNDDTQIDQDGQVEQTLETLSKTKKSIEELIDEKVDEADFVSDLSDNDSGVPKMESEPFINTDTDENSKEIGTENISQMASQIAEMINEINKEQ